MPGDDDDKPRATLTLDHGARKLAELAEAATQAEAPATEPGDAAPTEVGERASTRHMGPRSTGGSLPTPSLQGYAFGDLLGRGGMGEVIVAHDQRIGRDVAVKRLRGTTPNADLKARFLREARIQARLDHPSIVPVYELGYDDNGQPFFTMKKVAGTTLTEVLASPSPPPRPRLLRAFVELCHAVEFAHERGVVHRDLKPSNVIVGRFHEVYILDWGLARVMRDAPDPTVMTPGDVDSLDGLTLAGALLGTPGYMAPEQARGEAEIGRAADVYALGSILFEILAGEPLHPKGERALASTIENATASPASRRPDRQIPPELKNQTGALALGVGVVSRVGRRAHAAASASRAAVHHG